MSGTSLAVAAMVCLSVACSGLFAGTPRPFTLGKGVHVTDLTGIEEGFSVQDSGKGYFTIEVNVGADRLADTFIALTRQIKTPGFLILGLPAHRDTEKQLRSNPEDPLHRDFYYLDGLDNERMTALFRRYQELFVNDGMMTVGCGSHGGIDEVTIERYKLVQILAADPAKYVAVLEKAGFARRERLKTVFDNFTEKTPGSLERLTIGGKDGYAVVDELKREGLYMSNTREE